MLCGLCIMLCGLCVKLCGLCVMLCGLCVMLCVMCVMLCGLCCGLCGCCIFCHLGADLPVPDRQNDQSGGRVSQAVHPGATSTGQSPQSLSSLFFLRDVIARIKEVLLTKLQ